jgi:hypothetical protein
MTDFESSIDKTIREAIERGDLDDLPGKGQPIRWEDESMVRDDQRMANRLLKHNGFTLDWIALGQELDAEYAAICRELENAHAGFAAGRIDAAGWHAARERFTGKARKLNQRVTGYNMRVPHESLQRRAYRVDPDDALKR